MITQDNTTLGVPEGEDGKEYYLPDDLTDQAAKWLHTVRAQDQTKPWFIYYSTGCAHAPHHVAMEWSEKYRGKFDQGWDALREETFERQKKLGVIPPDAVLTPRPDAFPAWDSLSESEKKLYARQMEVYAGYQENCRLERRAAARRGAGDGRARQHARDLHLRRQRREHGGHDHRLVQRADDAERDRADARAAALADRPDTAGSTPGAPTRSRRTTRAPGRGRATRRSSGASRSPRTWAARATAWSSPGRERIRDAGALRSQFTHCIDIGPTILEAAGIPEPKVVDGIAQKPMEGTSFLYSFDDASAAERHTVQYFEIYGNRAIYKDGWWAACKLDRIPWDASPPTIARFAPGTYDPEQDTWELYYLPDDFTQANDLAAEHPEKLAELKELFWEEAEKHNVLPLLAGFSVFFGILPPMPTITTHTFYGDVENIASGMIPRVYGHSYAIEAELSVPEQGAEGVIVAEADEMGGFSLWVDNQGLLHHSYSMMGVEQYKQVSTEPIPTGDVTVRMQFDADRQERSAGGTVSLYANDQMIGEGRLEKTVFLRFSAYAGMDIGRDNGLVVDRAYAAKAPYAFTGTVKKVVFDLKPAARHEDEKALHEAAAHGATAHGISA